MSAGMDADWQARIEASRKRAAFEREAMALWRAHGGAQHGPHVEHVYMRYSNFFEFIDALVTAHGQHCHTTTTAAANQSSAAHAGESLNKGDAGHG